MAKNNRTPGERFPILEWDDEGDVTLADAAAPAGWGEGSPSLDGSAPGHRFHVPTDLACGSWVRQQIQSLATDQSLSPGDTADLVLAVSEAFNNAVRHGTSGPADPIEFWVDIRRGKAIIELRYLGEPFEVGVPELPMPTASSGRGRYIMAMLLDHMEYRFDPPWTVARLIKNYRRLRTPRPRGPA